MAGRRRPICCLSSPDIRAVSFVGSVPVGRHVYATGCGHLKRVQSLAGAKNHLVVMPDADRTQVVNALVGASCGAAGQRCMAVSVAVFVGAAKRWLPDGGGGDAEGCGRVIGAIGGPILARLLIALRCGEFIA